MGSPRRNPVDAVAAPTRLAAHVSSRDGVGVGVGDGVGAGVNDVDHRFRTVVATVHRRLLDLPDASADIDANPVRIESCVRDVAPLCTDREVESIVRAVLRQLDGFGPLEPLLADPTITEVMVNGSGTVWIERRGRIESSGIILDVDAVRLVVDRPVVPSPSGSIKIWCCSLSSNRTTLSSILGQ